MDQSFHWASMTLARWSFNQYIDPVLLTVKTLIGARKKVSNVYHNFLKPSVMSTTVDRSRSLKSKDIQFITNKKYNYFLFSLVYCLNKEEGWMLF